ncbi:TetR/AcrR family transcriptional regulator [Cellulomonas alba]|uniref:TetR/AcrR family transcriptional regulator C-terminal domain-containing protein n=1 Tax=Cellulomonas alba TaxID=3053467 RepID=A0ABT7SHW9_9CELL|nr:TetR/AcrR family transcriptional regulator C-terminal domain-containing protein [Cellulomonas alba]MDM7855788.1 TetR/AcrR family transcriptional regulator C-terminal domain-containing protein [Cellulomonas alba]
MPARKSATRTATRAPLTRDRVLRAACELADEDGLDALTMRRLADALGVEAMSLYHHVPNKDAILDGLVELAFAEFAAEGALTATPATTPETWERDLRARILAARRVLLRHRWVPQLVETRAALAPAMVQYVDGVVGLMHAGGLSYDLIHHAMHALGSRVYGFTQELAPDDSSSGAELDPRLMALVPNLAAMLAEVVHDDPGSTLGWCDDQTEFEFGLDLLLEGLERRRAVEAGEG